jgi:hypothetical protein
MRYFSFKNSIGEIETMSEEEIRKEWWPVWYAQMCERYEKAYVDEHYWFWDSLDAWMIAKRAWEVLE